MVIELLAIWSNGLKSYYPVPPHALHNEDSPQKRIEITFITPKPTYSMHLGTITYLCKIRVVIAKWRVPPISNKIKRDGTLFHPTNSQ